jgi:acyl carrier protein
MSNADITKEEIMAIYPKVAEIIADALGCDEEDVKPDSSLINDLDAESIDFLDIVFRLEREFKVVHIDVGVMHRNLDLVEEYGNPIDKGIPSVVLLDADGKSLFVNHGALSNAALMKPSAVQRYFERLASDGRVD